MNLLYINNKWIKSFDELVEVFDRPEAKNSDEPLYDRLIDLTVDQDLAVFLEAMGKRELSNQIRSIEISDGDPIIMEALQKIITGKKVEIPKDTNSRIRFISATIDTDATPAKAVFKVQILKVKQEIVKFSVLSKKQCRKDKVIHLNEYKKNDEIEIQIDLNEPSDEICFAIDGKEVCRCTPDYLIAFHCNVSDANLTIDGTQIEGTFPIEERLCVGSHTIKVSKVGYDDYKEQIVVSRKSVREIELTEQPFGKDRIFKVGDVSFVMKAVKGGDFVMGHSPCYNEGFYPPHNVTLKDYYIGETVVTRDLWHAVMGGKKPSRQDANKPINLVSWNDAWEFISKLNQELHLSFRMPTEAQWEYAARGGKDAWIQHEYAGSDIIDSVAWYVNNSGNESHPVKCKGSNELGLYDMSGNVREWCFDWYDANYYAKSPTRNPEGPQYGERRVTRGGSFCYSPSSCKVYSRSCGLPSGSFDIGFRLVLEP